MKFHVTSLPGLWLIELELREDERGFLARTFCENEFAQHGLNIHWPQCNLTLTKQRGALRGMHYQTQPKPEVKLIRCAAGKIHDVVLDVRRDSPTFGQWEAFELSAANRRQLYVPAGFAHGFQCLADNSEVFYQMSEFFAPDCARGVRWDDPFFKVSWPMPPSVLSPKDQQYPDFDPAKDGE